MSFDAVVQWLDEADVVAIVTTRANDSPIATPIWSVVVGGVPYLRSAFGPHSWWYKHVLAGRPVAIALGDGHFAERDRTAALDLPREPVAAVYIPADAAIQRRIDDALRRKYPAGSSLDAMLSDLALSCTLRVSAV